MAGNFLKYGAAEATFGSKNAGDLPVDAHELIALCAPRLTFISYGVPERGDAKWLDQQGSFMAAVAAQPVFRLLGAKDLGVSDDYTKEKMPAVNVGLLDGQLAWRQHDGGHTDGPNWKYFIPWADKFLGAPVDTTRLTDRPIEPAPRDRSELDDRARAAARESASGRHRCLLRRRFDHPPLGRDRLSRPAGQLEPELLRLERRRTSAGAPTGSQNILWRLENGELDGVNPKVIVILAGTNNVGAQPGGDARRSPTSRAG